jgi:ribonuclease HI
MLTCYTDAGWKTGGPIYVAHVLCGDDDKIVNKRVLEGYPLSSTFCEYLGLIYAMRYCLQINELVVEFKNDNQTMMRQLNCRYKVNTPELIAMFDEVYDLKDKFNLEGGQVKFTWIPREENLADAHVEAIKHEKPH